MSASALHFAAAVGFIGVVATADATPIPLHRGSTESMAPLQRAGTQVRVTYRATAPSHGTLPLSERDLALFTVGYDALLPFGPRVGTVSEPSQAALIALGLGVIGLAMHVGRRRHARRSDDAVADATPPT